MLKNKEIFSLEKEINWLEEKTKYKRLSALNIHDGQPDILAYIYLHKNTSQYDIARYLGLSRASVGISLKRMEKSGFITISKNEHSKRSTCVNISEQGIKVLVKADMVLDEYISHKFDEFSEEEIEQYLSLMKKIKRNLTKAYKKSLGD
ncbi:MAG: MarR family transcriptional regulator [Erysipelotrichia bacterium]|nr:MarR family transcriptional regulator [Erysipelotrichia bacterium]NCC55466.1 MarR family transcriptional regulator [Erysipelotrichia bacterium]